MERHEPADDESEAIASRLAGIAAGLSEVAEQLGEVSIGLAELVERLATPHSNE